MFTPIVHEEKMQWNNLLKLRAPKSTQFLVKSIWMSGKKYGGQYELGSVWIKGWCIKDGRFFFFLDLLKQLVYNNSEMFFLHVFWERSVNTVGVNHRVRDAMES